MKTDLAIALDFSTTEAAEKLIKELQGLPVVYKVGLELFLSAGPSWVKSVCASGHRVFLDLKFHDIPNTVAAAVAQAHDLGVEFATVHLSGGVKMLDAITRAPKVLGVSVLTSFSEDEWKSAASLIADSVKAINQSVLQYAQLANGHAKVFGMVCSPKEISEIRRIHPSLFLVVPGIRPEGSASNDQARTMTPAEAAHSGASMIVVGRPITQANQHREMTEKILKEIGR